MIADKLHTFRSFASFRSLSTGAIVSSSGKRGSRTFGILIHFVFSTNSLISLVVSITQQNSKGILSTISPLHFYRTWTKHFYRTWTKHKAHYILLTFHNKKLSLEKIVSVLPTNSINSMRIKICRIKAFNVLNSDRNFQAIIQEVYICIHFGEMQ